MLRGLGENFKRSFVTEDVVKNVEEYFSKENLLNYEIIDIVDYSEHPDDNCLFMVVAKTKDGFFADDYTVWTCWNNSTKSLNFGHYNISKIEGCKEVVRKYYKHLR